MDKNVYTKNSFERIFRDEEIRDEIIYKGQSFWQGVISRFKRNKGAVVGLTLIGIIIVFAIIGPHMNEYTYKTVMTENSSLPPKVQFIEKLGIFNGVEDGVDIYEKKGVAEDVYYWLGTDDLGRDIWTRVWVGTRVSLYIAFLAMVIDMLIGMTYGMISGYIGGRVDNGMQRVIEIISGIPQLVVVTLFVMILNPGILSISLALVITGWIGMSRVVRSQVLRLKELEFILASKTLGASTKEIIGKDIFPNIFGQVIIMSMFSIPSAIFYESFLAFIGLGLQPPMASLGVLINDGYKYMSVHPYMVIAPVTILGVLMLSFNLLADGLRDALDPKMKDN